MRSTRSPRKTSGTRSLRETNIGQSNPANNAPGSIVMAHPPLVSPQKEQREITMAHPPLVTPRAVEPRQQTMSSGRGASRTGDPSPMMSNRACLTTKKRGSKHRRPSSEAFASLDIKLTQTRARAQHYDQGVVFCRTGRVGQCMLLLSTKAEMVPRLSGWLAPCLRRVAPSHPVKARNP